MSEGWIYTLIGVGFCISGLYLFFKNSFEEGKTILRPALVMIVGVILIGIGTAKQLGLVE